MSGRDKQRAVRRRAGRWTNTDKHFDLTTILMIIRPRERKIKVFSIA